jgi:Fe-S-cluster containining protein
MPEVLSILAQGVKQGCTRGRALHFADAMTRDRQPRLCGESLGPALAEVRRIYADLAARPHERQCMRRTECCHFKLTGLTPYLTKGEALAAAKAWRATGRRKLPESNEGSCPMLEPRSGRCLIYVDRPFGCRTHYCSAAGGPLARQEVLDLIRRLEVLDAQLTGDGSHQISTAVTAALREMA